MNNIIIFRITDNGQFTEDELKRFAEKHTNIVIIKEYKSYNPAVGPHFHGWFNGNLTKKTLINYFKSELHCKGNEDYSISQKELKQFNTEEGYYRYCCKGENAEKAPNEFYNINLTAVLEYHKNYYLKQEEFKTIRIRGSKRLAELSDYASDKLATIYENRFHHLPLIILQYHDEKSMMISDFQVENYYNFLRSKLDPDYINERANRIYNKVHKF